MMCFTLSECAVFHEVSRSLLKPLPDYISNTTLCCIELCDRSRRRGGDDGAQQELTENSPGTHLEFKLIRSSGVRGHMDLTWSSA